MKHWIETSEQRKNPPEYSYSETWFQAYKTLIKILPCTLRTEGVTWWFMKSTFSVNADLKLSNIVNTFYIIKF